MFRMKCPVCGTAVIAASPLELIWEFCPGCGSHIWDIADIIMAEAQRGDGSQGRITVATREH